jgi:hypothetical protein
MLWVARLASACHAGEEAFPDSMMLAALLASKRKNCKLYICNALQSGFVVGRAELSGRFIRFWRSGPSAQLKM